MAILLDHRIEHTSLHSQLTWILDITLSNRAEHAVERPWTTTGQRRETSALGSLEEIGPDLGSLPSALDSEQAAYQAMLKLRAREHQVMRSRQQKAKLIARALPGSVCLPRLCNIYRRSCERGS